MANTIIKVENLTKKFGPFTAVDNLNLEISEGEVFGLLGPNGAGKTTTIRMLSCLIAKTNGNATIGEFEINKPSDHQKIRKMIGILPENVGLYEELSAYKNLDFFGRYYDCSPQLRKERIEYFLKEFGLWEKRNQSAGSFSKGMKQKLAIARTLIHDPQIIFLDEPTANLDPEAARLVIDYILDLKKEQRTIILNTHMLDEAERICDRVGILKTQLKAIDSPKKLEESLGGKKTVIVLTQVTPDIVSAIKNAGSWTVEVVNNQITIGVTNPEEENPLIDDVIHSSGGRLQSMTIVTSSLEETYLNIVRS
ncbi:MAG: ABC transporter ATP-binding protein [Candidatus Thorarchaeota archaeon]